MKKVLFAFIVAILFQTDLAKAFDGKRAGWVMGVGLGAGSVTGKTTLSSQTSIAPILGFNLGYAFNNHFQLGIGKRSVVYVRQSTDVYNEIGGLEISFLTKKFSFIIGGGVSAFANEISLNPEEYLYGQGYYLGFGYEFSKHYGIELMASSQCRPNRRYHNST